jgi:hypothetical protein
MAHADHVDRFQTDKCVLMCLTDTGDQFLIFAQVQVLD